MTAQHARPRVPRALLPQGRRLSLGHIKGLCRLSDSHPGLTSVKGLLSTVRPAS